MGKEKERGNESAAKRAFDQYQNSLKAEKSAIKAEPSKLRRFLKWVWLLLKWPWRWLWMACHDWRLMLIFAVWMAIVGCEVWVPLLIASLSPDKALRVWMLSIAGTCEAFWLGPGTPFMPLCIALTIGTKAIIDKISKRKGEK